MVLASLLLAVVALVGGGAPSDTPDIELRAERTGDLPLAPSTIGGLADDDVLLVDVAGFHPRSDAAVVQCGWTPSGRSCEQLLTVSFDGRGHARFLVRVSAEVASVDCREADRPCVLAVVGGDRRAVAVTAFGKVAPSPMTITASPTRASPGDSVRVTLDHLPPSSPVSVVLCSPGPSAPRCGPSLASFEADRDGRARGSVTIGDGCARGQTCGLALVLDGEDEPVGSTPFSVTGSAGATYDQGRLRAGLLAAALLGATALVLLRRTDWTPVIADPFAGVELDDDPFGP